MRAIITRAVLGLFALSGAYTWTVGQAGLGTANGNLCELVNSLAPWIIKGCRVQLWIAYIWCAFALASFAYLAFLGVCWLVGHFRPKLALAPQKEFKPIHEVIAYVAERIGEPKETKTLLPRTRTAIRQAASDGRVRFRGRKQVGQIASNAKLTFDTILTDIPKDYWRDTGLNFMATEGAHSTDYHVFPEPTNAWNICDGEKQLYASVVADWKQVKEVWP